MKDGWLLTPCTSVLTWAVVEVTPGGERWLRVPRELESPGRQPGMWDMASLGEVPFGTR